VRFLKDVQGYKFGCHFSILHLRNTKTKGVEGEEIYLIDCLHSNPVIAFENHFTSSPTIPDEAPLFVWQAADGGWALMTNPWFMQRCRAVWEKEGLEMFDGHSF